MTDWKILSECKKISATKEPTLAGTSFLARIIYCIDSDSIVVARVVDPIGPKLERRTIRITMINGPEVPHKQSTQNTLSSYEAMLGTLAKNIVLHTILPDQFEIQEIDCYDWRKQQKIFDAHPVIVEIECPLLDSKGKLKQADPYKRELGSVSIVKSSKQETPINIANLLIDIGIADKYEGGKKTRSFMTSTQFIETNLRPLCGSKICDNLLDLYKKMQ